MAITGMAWETITSGRAQRRQPAEAAKTMASVAPRIRPSSRPEHHLGGRPGGLFDQQIEALDQHDGDARRRRQDVGAARRSPRRALPRRAAGRSAVISGLMRALRSSAIRRACRAEQRGIGGIARHGARRLDRRADGEGRARQHADLWPRRSASSGSWVTSTTVRPASSRAARSCSSSRVTASRWANGSSISTTGRSSQSVRASAARWRMPPDSVSRQVVQPIAETDFARAATARAVRRPERAPRRRAGDSRAGHCRARSSHGSSRSRLRHVGDAAAAALGARQQAGQPAQQRRLADAAAAQQAGRPAGREIQREIARPRRGRRRRCARRARKGKEKPPTKVTSPYAGINRIRFPGSFLRTSQPRRGSPR